MRILDGLNGDAFVFINLFHCGSDQIMTGEKRFRFNGPTFIDHANVDVAPKESDRALYHLFRSIWAVDVRALRSCVSAGPLER
jgi:hypothetical protein